MKRHIPYVLDHDWTYHDQETDDSSMQLMRHRKRLRTHCENAIQDVRKRLGTDEDSTTRCRKVMKIAHDIVQSNNFADQDAKAEQCESLNAGCSNDADKHCGGTKHSQSYQGEKPKKDKTIKEDNGEKRENITAATHSNADDMKTLRAKNYILARAVQKMHQHIQHTQVHAQVHVKEYERGYQNGRNDGFYEGKELASQEMEKGLFRVLDSFGPHELSELRKEYEMKYQDYIQQCDFAQHSISYVF